MRSFLPDLLNVSELTAIASFSWIGSGDKYEADRAATNSMRTLLNQIPMDGRVVIGEGEMDQAPMLYIGEKVGTGEGPKIDLAVDPIDGTTSTVHGQNDAITAIAAAASGSLLNAPDMYMEKIATGRQAAGRIDINAPLEENLYAVAEAKGKKINEITVIIQGRERHQEAIHTIRKLGGKVYVFKEGDVIPAISTCIDSLNIDLFLGIGGAPEGVLAAVGIKCLGGEMQARLLPRTEEEFTRCQRMGLPDPHQPLTHDQLINTDDCIFVATGITNNILLKGIRLGQKSYTTHSLAINGRDRKLRYVKSVHVMGV
ncbi:class II fructose-bisphosphatase [Caldibacillus debilis]|uniref:class II fructose-bisphosphatase n=1 Tax=Caldibacillus debilis TaxID=301148 RepID=UPI002FDAFB67